MGPYRAALVWFERYHACVQQDPRSYLPVPGVENTEFVNAAVKQAVMSVRYFLVSFFIGIILILLTLRLGPRPLLNILTILFILGDVFFCGQTSWWPIIYFGLSNVPKGRHEIVFEYWPTYFSVSIIVALVTVLGCCLLAIIARGRPARLEN